MRIIFLNKKAPEIGSRGDMRPIIVMSYVIKLIEYSYIEPMKEWVKRHINSA